MTDKHRHQAATSPCISYGEYEGRPAAFFHLSNGKQIIGSVETTKLYERLEYSTNITADRADSRNVYPRFVLWFPGRGRSQSITLASTLLPLRDWLNGEPYSPGGKAVRFRNGNKNDHRDENLYWAKDRHGRAMNRQMEDVKQRAKWLEEGLSPRAEQAKRCKEEKRAAGTSAPLYRSSNDAAAGPEATQRGA